MYLYIYNVLCVCICVVLHSGLAERKEKQIINTRRQSHRNFSVNRFNIFKFPKLKSISKENN